MTIIQALEKLVKAQIQKKKKSTQDEYQTSKEKKHIYDFGIITK